MLDKPTYLLDEQSPRGTLENCASALEMLASYDLNNLDNYTAVNLLADHISRVLMYVSEQLKETDKKLTVVS